MKNHTNAVHVRNLLFKEMTSQDTIGYTLVNQCTNAKSVEAHLLQIAVSDFTVEYIPKKSVSTHNQYTVVKTHTNVVRVRNL